MAKRYQRGNQNPYIEEEQTTQWPKDTKGGGERWLSLFILVSLFTINKVLFIIVLTFFS
jgi:hypothetical protein